MEYREIEVRFLEIDADALMQRLRNMGAVDKGGDFVKEIIFYDTAGKWKYQERKFVRIRQTKQGMFVTFKHNEEDSATGTKEIEFEVRDLSTVKRFLQEIGLAAAREQEKKRHTFQIDGVIVDIDTWPGIPTYVELEGPSEDALKKVAARLGLEWSNAVFESPRYLIEHRYRIPVSEYRYFTFDKMG